MANTEDKKLAIDVLARIDKLEKGMAKAAGVVDKQSRAMEVRTAKATKAMELSFAGLSSKAVGALTSIGTGMLAAGVSALAFGAIVAKTKEALAEFGNIADKSAQTGLDPERLQELAYGASLAGVEFDELSAALATFSKNSGLAVVGKGKMTAALLKLNPALLENIRNAKSQEERVSLAADAIDKAKTASEKAALATTLFGDAGTKLVSVFDGGAAAIERTAQQAQSLGIVISRDVIKRADELGDSFDTATKAIDVQFKSALIELAPVLVDAAKLAANVARAIASIVDSMRDLGDQSTRGLNDQLAALGKQRLDYENKALEILGSRNRSDLGYFEGLDVEFYDKKRKALEGEEKAILDVLAARTKAEEQIKASNKGGSGGDGNDPILPPITAPGSSTRNKAAEDAVRQAQAVTDLIADLKFEQSQVGKTATEQAAANALRTAGTAATEEQRAAIIKLINDTAAENAAIDATKARLDEAKASAASFVTTFRQGLVAGESAAKSFQNALLQLLDTVATKLESLAVDKLFSGLLGGAIPGIGGTVIGGVSGAGGSAVGKVAAPSVAKVLASAPKMPSIRAKPANDNIHVTFGTSVDNNGNLKPFVENVARVQATAIGKRGLEKYSRGQGKTDARNAIRNPRRTG